MSIRLDFDRHELTVHGRSVTLRHKEFLIFNALKMADGKVLSRNRLMEQVWGLAREAVERLETRMVDTHVCRMRRKIRAISEPASRRIVTVSGVGYKLVRA